MAVSEWANNSGGHTATNKGHTHAATTISKFRSFLVVGHLLPHCQNVQPHSILAISAFLAHCGYHVPKRSTTPAMMADEDGGTASPSTTPEPANIGSSVKRHRNSNSLVSGTITLKSTSLSLKEQKCHSLPASASIAARPPLEQDAPPLKRVVPFLAFEELLIQAAIRSCK
eukprot:gene35738-46364_t